MSKWTTWKESVWKYLGADVTDDIGVLVVLHEQYLLVHVVDAAVLVVAAGTDDIQPFHRVYFTCE